MEYTFGGKYKLEEEIGFGGCGSVYSGTHTIAGKQVAIKLEPASSFPAHSHRHAKHDHHKHHHAHDHDHPRPRRTPSMLQQESRIYKALMGGPGVPWMVWSGKQGDYNVMVMDLMGPSLEDLFRVCNRCFSLKTVLLLADQMLSHIEFIHSREWVHRDIKPANFLMGPDLTSHSPSHPHSHTRVNVIDFGLAKKYVNPHTSSHIRNTLSDKNGVGTPLFASINTHLGNDCSRRDDLESLCYTLVYFLKGSLPWRKVKPPPQPVPVPMAGEDEDATPPPPNPKLAWDAILQSKLAYSTYPSTSSSSSSTTPSPSLTSRCPLTHSLPLEFDVFYHYTRTLAFEDLPDYEGIRRMFRALAEREGIEYDGVYDWTEGGEWVWKKALGGTGTRGAKAGRVGGEKGAAGKGGVARNPNPNTNANIANGHAAAKAGPKRSPSGGKPSPGPVPEGGGGTRRRRFCEACEARAVAAAAAAGSTVLGEATATATTESKVGMGTVVPLSWRP